MDALPQFKYHPDPLGTGVVEPSKTKCKCCGRKRGFIYVGPVYAERELRDALCPWCIADGSAAAKLGASFADDYPLKGAGVPQAIIDEVHLRTPSYISWQQSSWLAHCGDACEFHGDASFEDVRNASPETKSQLLSDYDLGDEEWEHITAGYNPGGNPAFYKFKCRHCGFIRLGWDCS